jgi:hypothetical protein
MLGRALNVYDWPESSSSRSQKRESCGVVQKQLLTRLQAFARRKSALFKLHRKLGEQIVVTTPYSLHILDNYSLTACDRAFLITTYTHSCTIMPGSESHHDQRRMRSASPTQSGLWETAQRFYSKSYAGDYIGLVILLLTLSFFEFSGEPFHQMFTIDDPRIQHPHAEIERVPVRKFLQPFPLSTPARAQY